MGFFTWVITYNEEADLSVAIPFRVGWGFSLIEIRGHSGQSSWRRNPFQGGMGFFTRPNFPLVPRLAVSQSLSGWDGVFHVAYLMKGGARCCVAIPFRVGWGFSPIEIFPVSSPIGVVSQSLSGWDGVFHQGRGRPPSSGGECRRNPFQGGMGFFTPGRSR